MIRSAWPFAASRRSPLVSVSANSTVTTSSLIIVFAFVGPRPVYSRNTPTASVEISAVSGFSARCSSIPTLSPLPRTGTQTTRGKGNDWSPTSSTHSLPLPHADAQERTSSNQGGRHPADHRLIEQPPGLGGQINDVICHPAICCHARRAA